MASNISDTLWEEVIDTYMKTGSILETASICKISTVKVRKILITEELWNSRTSEQVGELLDTGLASAQIAEKLCMSIKNVQAYMPYERGTYGSDKSVDAIRADRYRNRMKVAANMQHVSNSSERMEDIGKMIIETTKNNLDVMLLHLELDYDWFTEEDKEILRKHGDMDKAFSRDILVPSDITLHALNYAILRAFGWQNGHLHHFAIPEEVFDELTDDRFAEWLKLAGVYFRFPTDDLEDIYWDDNYREGESIRSWMRRKYTGPYRYKGLSEHYIHAQRDVLDMIDRIKEVTVHEYVPGIDIQKAPYKVRIEEASVNQIEQAFVEFFCHELIERLSLAEVLTVGGKKADIGKVRDEVFGRLEEIDVDRAIAEYEYEKFSDRARREYLDGFDIPVVPIAGELSYRYDYGDGWEVKITCDALYSKNADGKWSDDLGVEPHVYPEELEEVVTKHKPICIAKDGIELVDDVGGPSGFCEMLKTIYEYDHDDDEARIDAADMRGWVDMLGWTGRKIGVKQTL